MSKRALFIVLFALALNAPGAAWAQSNCPASADLCADPDISVLEEERVALIAELAARDPQNAALASERTWLDGVSSCVDDVACYRDAYLNHNQSLRQSLNALPGAAEGAPLDAPADAPSVEEETAALDEAQEERFREAAQQERGGDAAYVPSTAPGWGFYTMIGVTLAVFWWLLRAMARNRRELRAEEARLRARR